MQTMDYVSSSERIYTNRLIIERFDQNDEDFFLTITSDKLIKKYFSSFRYLNDCKEFFHKNILNCQDSGSIFLIIKIAKDSIPIGFLNAFYYGNATWIIEYAILEEYRKNGFMYEVIEYICTNQFEFTSTFKTNQYTISGLIFEVKPYNKASIKLLQKIASTLDLSINYDDKYNQIYIEL